MIKERALAHIEEVAWIKPIEGADNIELIGILGWTLISKKGEFQVGDRALFIEIDSQCPSNDERFSFLAAKKYKVRTYKLNKFGVVSQGLALPISLFPEFVNAEIGEDVTKQANIIYSSSDDRARKGKINPEQKYNNMKKRHQKFFSNKMIKWLMRYKWFRELMFSLFGSKTDVIHKFPKQFQYINVTDEERVENMPWVLNNKDPFIVTEKLDGTSSTYILERKKKLFGGQTSEFYVCSRNVRLLSENEVTYHKENVYWNMENKYQIRNILQKYLDNHPEDDYVCIQGEIVGVGVQGNPLQLENQKLYVFNFISSSLGRVSSEFAAPVIRSWGLNWVPVVEENYILPNTMDEFKKYATASSMVNPDVLREGVVLRNYNSGLSFKNVSIDYLLKH